MKLTTSPASVLLNKVGVTYGELSALLADTTVRVSSTIPGGTPVADNPAVTRTSWSLSNLPMTLPLTVTSILSSVVVFVSILST